jgi:hypothetical protein
MSRSHVLGPTGTIPYDEYLRKIQSSSLEEDPDQYEKYLRRQLVDFRPDAPFFESDQVRDPSDRGSGFGSRERLALRHCGARSEEEPFLPDGTFLDHEFMERDPRGTQNQPDFGQVRKHAQARGRFTKFYDDNDLSVPETGVNPVQMVALIRGSQHQMRDRLKIFDDSMDGWHNGGGAVRMGKNRGTALTTVDGTIMDLADATARQRQDPVGLLSNRTAAMLRLTSPDHRVKVSKYGQVRPVMSMESNQWNTNRYNSYLDHQIPVEINGQMVNRMLGLLILDLEGQRATKQMVAQGTDYDDSQESQLREMRQRIHPEDLYKMIQIGMTSSTQAASANQEFYAGKGNVNRGHNEKFDPTATMRETMINHDIAASMVQVNRTLGPQEQKDLRDMISTSAADHGVYLTQNNTRTAVRKSANTLTRDSLDTREIEEQRVAKQYGGIKPATHYNPMDRLDIEKFGKQSRVGRQRAGKRGGAKNASVDDVQNEAEMREFALPGRKETMSARSTMGRRIQSEFGDTIRNDLSDNVDMRDIFMDMMR